MLSALIALLSSMLRVTVTMSLYTAVTVLESRRNDSFDSADVALFCNVSLDTFSVLLLTVSENRSTSLDEFMFKSNSSTSGSVLSSTNATVCFVTATSAILFMSAMVVLVTDTNASAVDPVARRSAALILFASALLMLITTCRPSTDDEPLLSLSCTLCATTRFTPFWITICVTSSELTFIVSLKFSVSCSVSMSSDTPVTVDLIVSAV